MTVTLPIADICRRPLFAGGGGRRSSVVSSPIVAKCGLLGLKFVQLWALCDPHLPAGGGPPVPPAATACSPGRHRCRWAGVGAARPLLFLAGDGETHHRAPAAEPPRRLTAAHSTVTAAPTGRPHEPHRHCHSLSHIPRLFCLGVPRFSAAVRMRFNLPPILLFLPFYPLMAAKRLLASIPPCPSLADSPARGGAAAAMGGGVAARRR